MSEKRSAHTFQVGEEFAPLEFTVSPELNQQYLYAEEDFHPRYVEGDESGGPIVHASLLLNFSNKTRSPSFYLDPGWASVHAGDDTRFINPARVGKKFTVTYQVSRVYEKRGRPWQEVDILVVDEDGTEILWRRLYGTYAAQQFVKKQ